MGESLAATCLTSSGLPAAWAGQVAWTVLDTDFRNGQHFLDIWNAWATDSARPDMLHYVGIAPHVPRSGAVQPAPLPRITASEQHRELLRALTELGADPEPGFHRILLSQGQVSLTLCLGAVEVLLSEHVFQADTLIARAPADKWTAQLLARRCRRGTRFVMVLPSGDGSPPTESPPASLVLRGAGFQVDPSAPQANELTGRFDPPWEMRTGRRPLRLCTPAAGRCAVIGAGLTGAAVAHSLALRGWTVSVVDQENSPAGGASGLPAGLAAPHVSVDDSPRSRLSRSGIHLTLQHARRLLTHGQDWEHSGVLERRPDGESRWHAQAAWLKPRSLVGAWLDQPAIRFTGNTQISALHLDKGVWSLQDTQDRRIGPFEMVVLTNAADSASLLKQVHAPDSPRSLPGADLLDKVTAIQRVHGTLSHGIYAETIPDIPAVPVNGNGCFIPGVPGAGAQQWCVGSTYELDPYLAADLGSQHMENMYRLKHLLPGMGQDLADTLDRGPVAQWSATRCVTHDRLPLVGPVGTDDFASLWLCVGMGSRGLSFASLCAELLVSRICAEPLPVEFRLARRLDVNRVRRKRHAGQTTSETV